MHALSLIVAIASAFLFAISLALLAAALVLDQVAIRARDYLRFEERAVLSQRLMLIAFVVFLALALISTPLLGLVFCALAAAWVIFWLPASRRWLRVNAEAVFEAPPASVAAVMFDVSQQKRWMQAVVDAVLETPGLLREGSVIRQTISLSGHELVGRLVVTEFEPYARLVMTLQVRHSQPFDLFEIESHERGSLVRYAGGHAMSLSNAILSGWRLPWLRRQFVRRRAENLERLRALVAIPRIGAT